MRRKKGLSVKQSEARDPIIDLPYVALLVAVGTPYAYMLCLFLAESFYTSLNARWAVRFTLPSELLSQGGVFIALSGMVSVLLLYLHSFGRILEKTAYRAMIFAAMTFVLWDPRIITNSELSMISVPCLHLLLSICSVYVIGYGVSRLILLRTHAFDHQLQGVLTIGFLIMHSILGPRYYGIVKADEVTRNRYSENLIYSDTDASDVRLLVEKCSGGYLVRLESSVKPTQFRLMTDLKGFHHL